MHGNLEIYLINILLIIVSIISLLFSIKAIKRQEPHIKIRLLDKKLDSYYGATRLSKEGALTDYAAYLRFRISNNSLSPVTISEIALQKNNEKFELAKNNVDYWGHVVFYFDSDDNEYRYDGTYIDYKNEGVNTPFVLKAYEAKDITCVFMSFPKSNNSIIKSKLIVDTAAGIICKNVDLNFYNEEFTHYKMNDYDQYLKSM